MSIEGRAKSRTEPAPSAGEWPWQPLPATKPPPEPMTTSITKPPATNESPTATPPPKKMPRREPSPLTPPKQTALNKTQPASPPAKPARPDPPTNEELEKGCRTIEVSCKALSQLDAVRRHGEKFIYLFRKRQEPNQPLTKQWCYCIYIEETNHVLLTCSPDGSPDHHPTMWRDFRNKFNKGKPVNNAAAMIDKLTSAGLVYIQPV